MNYQITNLTDEKVNEKSKKANEARRQLLRRSHERLR